MTTPATTRLQQHSPTLTCMCPIPKHLHQYTQVGLVTTPATRLQQHIQILPVPRHRREGGGAESTAPVQSGLRSQHEGRAKSRFGEDYSKTTVQGQGEVRCPRTCTLCVHAGPLLGTSVHVLTFHAHTKTHATKSITHAHIHTCIHTFTHNTRNGMYTQEQMHRQEDVEPMSHSQPAQEANPELQPRWDGE